MTLIDLIGLAWLADALDAGLREELQRSRVERVERARARRARRVERLRIVERRERL